MSKDDSKDLRRFLKPFDEETAQTVLWLREWVWDLYPETNELIYDNYNALAFGWSHTARLGHTFCSIAAFRTNKHVHFVFIGAMRSLIPKKSCWAKEINTGIFWSRIKKLFQRLISKNS